MRHHLGVIESQSCVAQNFSQHIDFMNYLSRWASVCNFPIVEIFSHHVKLGKYH